MILSTNQSRIPVTAKLPKCLKRANRRHRTGGGHLESGRSIVKTCAGKRAKSVASQVNHFGTAQADDESYQIYFIRMELCARGLAQTQAHHMTGTPAGRRHFHTSAKLDGKKPGILLCQYGHVINTVNYMGLVIHMHRCLAGDI